MIRERGDGRYVQTTESKHTAQSNFLCPWLMKTPNVWDWEKQKSPICDDVGHRVTDEESVDVHSTGWVSRFVPLGYV